MSGAYSIAQQLLRTHQPTAVGIGHFVNALLNFAKAEKTPVLVEHMNKDGATQVMMFSRQKLSTDFSSAIQILRKDLGIGQGGYYYGTEDITITGALFYDRDGAVGETPYPMSKESWPDLMAHVHTVFVRTSKV